jgi:hypothetical protein
MVSFLRRLHGLDLSNSKQLVEPGDVGRQGVVERAKLRVDLRRELLERRVRLRCRLAISRTERFPADARRKRRRVIDQREQGLSDNPRS